MVPGVVAVLESHLTVPRACPCPVALVDGVAVARCAPRLTRRGAEGATDGGLAPVKGRTVFEVAAHAAEGPAKEKSQRFGSTVVVQCQTCSHSALQVHTAPGIAA